MKRKLLICVCALTVVISTINIIYACCQDPTSDFLVTPDDVVCAGTSFSFNASDSYDPDETELTYEWNFGDGDTGSGETVTHSYDEGGEYTVTLHVIDNDDPCCCGGGPNCEDGNDVSSQTVKVVGVESLEPDSGTEFDDGDGDPDTKSYGDSISDSGKTTDRATPKPSMPEEELPDPWTFTGGTGTRLTRTCDRTIAGITTFTCTAGTSSKQNTIYVVEAHSLEPDIGTEIDDGDGDPDTKSYVVAVSDTDVVTIIAAPYPSLSAQNLPSDWSLTGTAGTKIDNLTYTVDRTTPGVATITATCGSSSQTTTIYVVEVVSVTWETYLDNTSISSRIYPGKQGPYDTADYRNKVRVKATITPVIENVGVRFSWWDVDDPSSDPTIDDNDSAGPTGDDNNGSGEGLTSTYAPTDGSGHARVTFTVTMNPGDNYKIAASTNQTRLGEMTQAMADGQETLPATVVLSDMLTTWRMLWIERDSMDTIATTGAQKNYVSGTASNYEVISSPPTYSRIDLGQNLPDELDDKNHFNPGRYHPSGHPTTYNVYFSSNYYFDEDYIKVIGDPKGDNVSKDYDLYDDDYFPVTMQPYITLPAYPDLTSWYEDQFERAYISIEYVTSSLSNVVSFDRNLSVSHFQDGTGDWDDNFNFPPSAGFWSVLSVTAFQFDENEDNDGEGETACGGTSLSSSNKTAVYLEVLREGYWNVSRIMAHEIVNAAAIEDCGKPSCIMGGGSIFCDDCLVSMRNKGSTW